MTDKVQKIKEWIQIRKLCTMDEHMKFYCKEAESDYNILCNIEKVLDSQQEVPVSEDLEEVIRKYEQRLEKENPATEAYDFASAIRFGANWQKQQMVAKAIDGYITFDYDGYDDKTYGCIAHDSFCLEDLGLKDTDKVKIIIIKED